ncbi:MAG: fibronectin type III domain-containing protein [Eubacterium sp.]|nr:fibronectin type III domain-containing protein [Eubacterium sp.]
MKKRILSIVFAVLIAFASCPITAFAADSFADELKAQGFPDSYISSLTELHKKYPNWKFEALITNESFSTAVSKERTTHKQQLIEKYSGNDNKSFYCTCSDCYDKKTTKKNIDGYIVKENPNWVSASATAVEYYMDPRNFLNEQYIFQFEELDRLSSEDSQTVQAGVEKILAGTWMANSNITYKDKAGKSVTYSPKTKYSKAILDAAEKSGLSAYYLASKIVQEVGGAKATAGGASGTVKGYEGIYNYYNLNAYTGAVDGLKWASQNTYYTNTSNVNLRQGASTSTLSIATLPLQSVVNIKYATEKQSDGYVWYSVSVKGKDGFIRSDLVTNYNRPWTDPYKSIVNGAVYIQNSFGKTQNTGYLQKFNVNPASADRHSHEYMANVGAAASEAYKTYTAFKGTDALSGELHFLIPVYNDMHTHTYKTTTTKATTKKNGSKVTKCTICGAKKSSSTIYYPKTISLSTTTYTYNGKARKPGVTVKDSKGNKIATSNYTVTYPSGRKNVGKYTVKIKFKGNYSGTVSKTFTIKPKATSLSKVTAGKKKFTVKWKKLTTQTTGYQIQYSTSSKFSSAKTVTVSKNSTTSKTVSSLKAKKKYYVRVRTYKTVKVNGKSTKIYSSWSKSKSITTKK